MRPIEYFVISPIILLVLTPIYRIKVEWVKWWHLFAGAAAASWVMSNAALLVDAPDNGVAYAASMIVGWIIYPILLLPVWILDLAARRVIPTLRQKPELSAGVNAIVNGAHWVVALGLVYGLFGWIPEGGALVAARKELIERGYTIIGEPRPRWVWGEWRIEYPESDFSQITLDRNGRMTSIGG